MGQRACKLHAPRDRSFSCSDAIFPPPFFDDNVWTASCRPIGSLSKFAQHVLLYQPDCRLFCDKGLHCKYFEDESSEHSSLFYHMPKDFLQSLAKDDMRSRQTLVVNAPDILDVSLPFTDHCWLLPSEGSLSAISWTLLPAQLRARNVIIYVHGFRQRFHRINNFTIGLRQHLAQANHVVMSFMWPCHKTKKSYYKARYDSAPASDVLRRLLAMLAAMNCTVSIFAHSLGCRVALGALLDNNHSVKVLAMAASAISHRALSPGQEFDRARIAAATIAVFHSSRDMTLKNWFRVGEGAAKLGEHDIKISRAMGLLGPDQPLPDCTSSFDVSEEVGSHSIFQYLVSKLVIVQLLSLLAEPEMLAQYDVEAHFQATARIVHMSVQSPVRTVRKSSQVMPAIESQLEGEREENDDDRDNDNDSVSGSSVSDYETF